MDKRYATQRVNADKPDEYFAVVRIGRFGSKKEIHRYRSEYAAGAVSAILNEYRTAELP